MKLMKKSLALLLALMLCVSLLTIGGLAAEPAAGDIVIVYTNDVHNVSAASNGAPNLAPYAKVAAYVLEMKALVGDDFVTLVDAGDAIQGEAIGTLTKGGYIIEIMNEIGYEVFVPGNHEFDYEMPRMLELMEALNAKVISANFVDLEAEEAVYDAYTIVDYGTAKVAFVGMTTPESVSKSTPKYFQNEEGVYIYGFCEGNAGQNLYTVIQDTVDAAIAEGADYVIAIGHMGIEESSAPYRSIDIIENTVGIDAFIDGHSHTVMEGEYYQNADGQNVLLTQTGYKLANIGQMVIAADGSITTTLVPTAEYEGVDEDALAYLNGISDLFVDELNEIVAKTDVVLTINDPTTGSRIIRNLETNLGDLAADAYRYVLGADIGIVNGGGIRANISAGDITYGGVISVHPYGNMGMVIEATGQQIIDALEHASRNAPGEFGGFLQVSGLEYTIDINKRSTVVVDDKMMFVEVAGERRVSNVKVGGVDIDLDGTYSVASHNYMLMNSGDGINMFTENEILVQPVLLDNQILITYISEYLDGVVGEEYSEPYGAGRITFKDEPAGWAVKEIEGAVEAGFVPDELQSKYSFGMTRAEFCALTTGIYETITGFEIEDRESFEDTDDVNVEKMAAIGVVNGVGEGLFAPDKVINREQAAVMLSRLAEALGQELPQADADFEDSDAIASWAIIEVGQMQALGIMIGDGGVFSPKTTYSREQSIATVYRIFLILE